MGKISPLNPLKPGRTFVPRGGSGTALPKFISKSSFERYIDKIFEDADHNQDGTINFSEVYELVLKFYVNLNRQAPVPPPSRETVMRVYKKSDKNRDKSLTRDEFEILVKTVSKRAFLRVGSFKVVKMLGAPLLAEYLIRTFAGKKWVSKVATTLIPERYREKVLPIISSKAFCRGALLVLLVSFLGNFTLGAVDMILAMKLEADEKD